MPKLLLLGLWTFAFLFSKAQIQVESINTLSESSLRGLSAVDESVCWVSGSEGTVMLTTDGGQNWKNVSPKGYESFQFRDIQAFGKDTAIILSAGLPAIVCKTIDGGNSWKEVYRNENEGVFFDAMDFWDNNQGIAFSDALEDKLLIITTQDGGETWHKIPDKLAPTVRFQQGGFAASGTCINTFDISSAIIGLGGAEPTILITHDFGSTWEKSIAPIDFGEPSKGIFSVCMLNSQLGYCVGGDYRADSLSLKNMALTNDGGKTWQAVSHQGVNGTYKSCIDVISADHIIATSRTGIVYTLDGGAHWMQLSGSYYSVDTINGVSWLSGPKGTVGRIVW